MLTVLEGVSRIVVEKRRENKMNPFTYTDEEAQEAYRKSIKHTCFKHNKSMRKDGSGYYFCYECRQERLLKKELTQ
mgnify:CR=1 FL=1